jgi:hypothetical protein
VLDPQGESHHANARRGTSRVIASIAMVLPQRKHFTPHARVAA